MLKIYSVKITYELRIGNKIEPLDTYQNFTIEEEKDAITTAAVFGAYSEEAAKIYDGCDIYEKKKGRRAVYRGWPSDIWINEWSEPDAKLIVRLSYEEESCSMQQLLELDANDVIAYLKQEYLNSQAYS
jgi:hypothetical protein